MAEGAPPIAASGSRREHVSMGLEWRGVSFSVPDGDTGNQKQILDNLSGFAEPGELLAIMGPSGAGKTSLLNALARLNPMATGEILLNGKTWEDSFDKLTAYMHQDEHFMPDLTVEEHLAFQAKCRLPAMGAQQRQELVNVAIAEMGLESRRNSKIGDAVKGGQHISKNERKRLNYATEILTQPSMLFVDEPTTGLDSFMAEVVVNDLKKLAAGAGSTAHQKRTVVATIHQPSSDIFRLFDKLLLLVDGKTVYFGPCSGVVEYFANMGPEWACPSHTNPADFFMRLFVNPKDVVNSSRRRVAAQQAYNSSQDTSLSVKNEPNAHELVSPAGGSFDRSFCAQILILFMRELKLRVRSDVAFKATIGRIIMFGVILGITFPNVDVDNMVVFSLNGVLFFSVFMQFFDIMIAQINSLPFLMDIYMRDMKNRAYSLFALYIAKNLCDVIFDVLFTFMWCCALYWPIGFGWYEFDNFLGFFYPLLMLTFVATGAGYFAGFIVPDPQAGFLVAIMLLFPFIIVAGIIVNLNSLPSGFDWLADISYLRFTFSLIAANQWDGFGSISCSDRDYEYNQCTSVSPGMQNFTGTNSTGMECSGRPPQTFPTGNHVLLFLGLIEPEQVLPSQFQRGPTSYANDERDWFRLCCAVAIFRLLGLFAIFMKSKPKKSAAKTTTVDAAKEAEEFAKHTAQVGTKQNFVRRARSEVHLQWSNLGMTGDAGNQIFADLTGEALPGELLAIIGPSGVGKSCLLNCLARKNTCAGTITPAATPSMALQTAYMYQEDLFLSDLTVREQLLFQAKMRLDESMSRDDLEARVDAIINSVGLTGSRNTQIGVIGAGISGGERKRLSFAEQVLIDPSLIFADEPTSGLDSAMAESVIEQLQSLAQGTSDAENDAQAKKRTVLATIHQPSSEIYQKFDKLLLLVQDEHGCGRTAFFGTPGEALNFFASIEHPCPTFLNPPDHYMRVISTQGIGDPGQKAIAFKRCEAVQQAWAKKQQQLSVVTQASDNANSNENAYDATLSRQFRTLLWRELLLRRRNEQLFKAYCGRTVMMTLVFGLLYYQIDNDQAAVQSIMGCITIVFMDTFFTAGIGVVQSVPFTFPTVFREHHSKQYSITAYFIAKQVADVPFEIVFTVLFSTGTYLLFGFTFDPFSKFVNWNLYILMAAFTANGLGYFCAALGYDAVSAFLVWTFLIIPFSLFSGFFINLAVVPSYLTWIEIISPFAYLFKLLSINHWIDIDSIDGCTPCNCFYQDGKAALKAFAIEEDEEAVSWVLTILFLILYRVMAYLTLIWQATRKGTRAKAPTTNNVAPQP